MSKKTPAAGSDPAAYNSVKARFIRSMKKNWELDLMALIPVVYLLLWKYYPMYGLQIAFKNYKLKLGIWDSPWVGLENFRRFVSAYNFAELMRNTLSISFYSIFVGFPIPIILALFLHVCNKPALKKITQNAAYIPHFLSVTVLVGMLNQLVSPISGVYGILYRFLGNSGVPMDIRSLPEAFPHLYVWSGVWQNMGWSTIIYVAALSAVPTDLHEAAQIDGASRWKRVLHVDIPSIMPTICIMLILRCGSIMGIGYEKVYLMQNALNMSRSEVLSTYVYKQGLVKTDYSYSTAISMFDSVINMTVMLVVNWIVRKISDGERGLF